MEYANTVISSFTSDNVGEPETIIAISRCKVIRIRENGDSTEYFLQTVNQTGWLKREAGEPHKFVAGSVWEPGKIVAKIYTATGSAEFMQEESSE